LAAFAILLTLIFGATPLEAATARACFREINARCAHVRPGGGRVVECVNSHFRDLSAPCQRLVVRARPIAAACRADMDRHCGHIRSGLMRLALCFNSNNRRFSARCRNAFAREAAHFR
jgi:hypothetical protein